MSADQVLLFPATGYQLPLLSQICAAIFEQSVLASTNFERKKVFLKVNLLGAYPPERAVTTHPLLVSAVALELKKRGAIVYIGDSPGGFPKPTYMDRVFSVTGMQKAAADAGAKIINLSAEKTLTRTLPSRFVQQLYLPRIIFEMDYLFTLPKIKTHTLTLYTGAVKNLFGIIPGYYKSEIHKRATRAEELSEFLVDLYQLLPPFFTIADALTIMEGEGPSGGRPQQLGVILAGKNAVEVDAVAAYLLGYSPEEIFTLKFAHARGLGRIDEQTLLNICPEITSYRRQFKLPRFSITRQLIEQAAFLGGGVVKPKVNQEKCQLCHFCQQSCPLQCITIKDKKLNFNYQQCIRCLCCQELCPSQAIYLERGRLAQAINYLFNFYQRCRKPFA